MENVVTESRRNIDKTKVYWRHKRRACSWCTIFFFFSFFFTRPTVCSLCDTTSHHRLIISIHKKTTGKSRYVLLWPLRHLDLSENNPGWMLRKKINKLNVFNISIMTFYIKKKKKQYMISTTKASEERERRDQGDMRQKNNVKASFWWDPYKKNYKSWSVSTNRNLNSYHIK